MRVLVVDDEPLARAKLRRFLELEEDVESVAECGHGFAALDILRTQRIDLLLLDIQMPEMSGFELLAQVAERPFVVFVTAYDRYAIDAFEEHALDYLLKPYDRARFVVALERVRKQYSYKERADMEGRIEQLLAAHKPVAYDARFVVRERDGDLLLLAVAEVDWLRAQGNYVALYAGERQHLVRDSLSKIERRVDPQLMLRIHRSTMVNIERIRALRPVSHGDYIVVLHDGRELAMSRTYVDRAREVLRLSF